MKVILNFQNRCKLHKKKLENIYKLRGLSREKLTWNEHERRVLLYQTKDEKIYMRYPGKESDKSFLEGGEGRRLNPFDFKPDLVFADGHSIRAGTNLQLGLMIESFVQENYKHKSMFISFLLSMAYYQYHRFGSYKASTEEVFFSNGKIDHVELGREITLNWCKQDIPEEFAKLIQNQYVKYDKNDVISVEALIHYIDVLAMQEDSKYQGKYAKMYLKQDEKTLRHGFNTLDYEKKSYDKKKKVYKNHYGRINFISTLSMVAYYTMEKGQKRTKELKALLSRLENNGSPIPVPLNKYETVTDGRVQFIP